MVTLCLSSTLYHGLPRGRAKRLCEKCDHSAIYLFIAGSYMPFALGALHGTWGWKLFGLIWGIAAIGIMLKAFDKLSHPFLLTGLYLAMGWLVVIAAVPFLGTCFRRRRGLAGCRRPRLHGRRRFLPDRRSPEVWPSHLASFRHGRHNLSLHRRGLVFRLGAVEEPCDASISPT